MVGVPWGPRHFVVADLEVVWLATLRVVLVHFHEDRCCQPIPCVPRLVGHFIVLFAVLPQRSAGIAALSKLGEVDLAVLGSVALVSTYVV